MSGIEPRTYELEGGLRVAASGPVVIEGVLHRIENRFVVCDGSLNNRAWDLTMFSSACPVCYPDARDCRIGNYVQADLFGGPSA
jgi:hypothetical protein